MTGAVLASCSFAVVALESEMGVLTDCEAAETSRVPRIIIIYFIHLGSEKNTHAREMARPAR